MSTSRNTFGVTRLATLTAAAVIPLMGAAAIETAVFPDAGFFMQSAQAQQGQGKGGNHDNLLNVGRGKGQGQMGGGQGRGQMGGSAESDVFRDDDGGRPEGKGQGGEDRGGKPDNAGGGGGPTSGKGGDYGDIVIILRDDAGNPILDGNGNIQPCLDAACETYTQLVEVEEGDYEMPEGVIPVEFGRLNVARSPESVTDHSLAELLSKLDGQTITAETLADMTDDAGRLLVTNDDGTISTIDSPLENFALYIALIEAAGSDPDADSYTLSITTSPMGDDPEETFTMTVDADVVMTLAASAFSAASDKYGDVTIDEMMNITGFVDLDTELSTLVDADSYSYDRDSLYGGITVWVLKEEVIDGTTYYLPTEVNLLDEVVFNEVPTIDDDANGIDVFTQQTDDAVQVLEYIHDFAIEPPATP
ncbi:hypothetical protein BOX17_15495 [Halomonas aestuarii]|uniref:Uncharacterized protein n=1 Tax=Halomonas aestuarii TaxID=1897729 RepID=A0A1J0VJN5_9GAMM|nr:hypothetical protein [Halomonas aestuarii]APE32235.1 hypothetical protein BOX17_15495 [Halomonas aestuarii]